MSRRRLQSFLFGSLVLIGASRSICAALNVGDLFPALTGIAVEGKLPDTKNRVLVVDFWASWCAPCKESFPSLARLQAQYDQQSVVVLGVSVDKEADDYAAFLRKLAPSFSVVRDRDQKLVSVVQVPVMPATYLIGRDGRIRAIVAGYHGKATEQTLRTAINLILAEHSSP